MHLRMASLNAWALPEPLARDVAPRMRAIARALAEHDLDVVALQEVWTAEARAELLEGAAAVGYPHSWSSGANLGGSGLLVVSRLPLVDAFFEPFRLTGHPERLDNLEFYSGKGFVRLRVEMPDGPLTLVNTHLHARYTKKSPHQFRAHRAGQLLQVAHSLMDVREPVVVLGDLNLTESHPEYALLAGLMGLRDAAAEAGQREPTVYRSPYRPRRRSEKRVDYVLVRDGDRRGIAPAFVTRALDQPFELSGRRAAYSNHAAVVAELALLRGPLGPVPQPDRAALALAAGFLERGREDALQRRRQDRIWAGGTLAAAVAGVGLTGERMNRRRFLRGSLRAGAALAATPALGFGLLSEIYVPGEMAAFDGARECLADLEARCAPS